MNKSLSPLLLSSLFLASILQGCGGSDSEPEKTPVIPVERTFH
ncbi:hypothetical protein [Colwellia sp. E2M01]|nr:hypothetical protein [Colwellia sp. E2M01]